MPLTPRTCQFALLFKTATQVDSLVVESDVLASDKATHYGWVRPRLRGLKAPGFENQAFEQVTLSYE